VSIIIELVDEILGCGPYKLSTWQQQKVKRWEKAVCAAPDTVMGLPRLN
jgi:hypothetical protein